MPELNTNLCTWCDTKAAYEKMMSAGYKLYACGPHKQKLEWFYRELNKGSRKK